MQLSNEYKNCIERKQDRIEVRLDETMLMKLTEIKRSTGISISEIVREAIRELLAKQFND